MHKIIIHPYCASMSWDWAVKRRSFSPIVLCRHISSYMHRHSATCYIYIYAEVGDCFVGAPTDSQPTPPPPPPGPRSTKGHSNTSKKSSAVGSRISPAKNPALHHCPPGTKTDVQVPVIIQPSRKSLASPQLDLSHPHEGASQKVKGPCRSP